MEFKCLSVYWPAKAPIQLHGDRVYVFDATLCAMNGLGTAAYSLQGEVLKTTVALVVSGHLRPSSLHRLSDDMLVVPEVTMGLSGDMPKVTMVAPRASTS